MLYAIKIYDISGSQPLRDIHRTAHLDYLKQFDDQTLFAGPFLTDDGKVELGSLRLVEFPDRAAAEKHVADEPYILGGLQERPSIQPWRPSVPYSWRDCPRAEGNTPFYIHAMDKPGSAGLREKLRKEHQDYQKSVGEIFITRGPILDDAGKSEIGSLMLIDMPDIEAARKFWAGEPFNTGGLFGEVELYRWRFGRVFDRFKTK